MKPKVYLLNKSGHDFKGVERYGEPIFLYDKKYINIFDTRKRAQEIEDKLDNINETDYIVCSGYTILNCIMINTALKKNNVVNVLLFNIKTRQYVARTLEDNA